MPETKGWRSNEHLLNVGPRFAIGDVLADQSTQTCYMMTHSGWVQIDNAVARVYLKWLEGA